MLKNIVIEVIEGNPTGHSIIVRADTERYGKNAIMYQDISFRLCCEYIARATGHNDFKLKARALTIEPTWLTPDLPSMYVGPEMYTDFEGRTMPSVMDVIL